MKLRDFAAALCDRVVLEMAVYFRNQDADIKISEEKNCHQVNVSSILWPIQ